MLPRPDCEHSGDDAHRYGALALFGAYPRQKCFYEDDNELSDLWNS